MDNLVKLDLKPGKFYKDRAGNLWCCYDYWNAGEALCQPVRNARHRRVRDDHEVFYRDGRYDEGGTRQYCLVAEVEYPYEPNDRT